MNKELTWVEAAMVALENSDDLWMTAPELVRKIDKTGIRELKSAHPQAVRSLRSALNSQSRKENGLFFRREEESSIYFALKKRLKSESNGGKAPSKVHTTKVVPQVRDKEKASQSKPQNIPAKPPLVNGLPPPPLPLHPLLPTQPYTIEIDPFSKSTSSNGSSAGNFCLPSPRQSMLGPIRTLHVFSESTPTNHRPVRQARMRKSLKDQENSSPDAMTVNSTHDTTPTLPTLAPPPVCEVLRLEACHPLPAFLSEVVCVRYPCSPNPTSQKSTSALDDDPCKAQGERTCSGRFEILSFDRCKPTSSESDFDDEEDDDDITSMDTQSDSEENESGDQVLLQPTPKKQLFIPKPLRRFSSSSYSESLRVDESLLSSETSQDESIPSPTKLRGYSVDLGRITGENNLNSARAVLRSTTEKTRFDGVVRKTNNSYVPYSLIPLDQKRFVSSLFQPSSPLVGENMKLLLNMNAYKGLTEYQKRKLQSLLPTVDRGGFERSPGSICERSFNNAFFSSALREWQEHVALGYFTPEHKAKMRGEKRRMALRTDELWKEKFYEESWGDKKEEAEDQRDSFPVPYYPHNQQLAQTTLSSQHTTECLMAMLDAYHGKDTKQEEELASLSPNTTAVPVPSSPRDSQSTSNTLPPPPPPPAPVIKHPSSTTAPAKAGAPRRERSATTKVSESLSSPKRTNRTTKSSIAPKKNHLVKKPTTLAQSSSDHKNLLPSLLKSKPNVTTTPPVNKKVAVNALKRLGMTTKSQQKARSAGTSGSSISKSLEKALLHSMRNQSSGQYLTRLPPKLPYQTLLSALEQASKDNTTSIKNKHNTPARITSHTPPIQQHTHSVFHDHFSLLGNEHVPTEFSLPITSLPIRLPRDMYGTCLRTKVVLREHSYSRPSGTGTGESHESMAKRTTPPSLLLHQHLQKKPAQDHSQHCHELSVAGLKISLQRSLIKTRESCECDRRALVFCSRCHTLYHTECVSSKGTLCPRCATIASLLGPLAS